MNARTGLVVGLIIIYMVLGIIDVKNNNLMTGIASLGLGVVNYCLFIGAK